MKEIRYYFIEATEFPSVTYFAWDMNILVEINK